MHRDEHLTVDREFFGEEFDEVHAWIDSSFAEYRGYRHWTKYHHLEAIEKMFPAGDVRHDVAVLHVMFDWASHFGRIRLPKNADEVEYELSIVPWISVERTTT